MFRKIAFTAIAVATLSFAALAPASAGHGGGHGMHMGSYHGGHHGGHFRHGGFWGGGIYVAGGSCWKTVWTDMGPRRVYVCNRVF